MYKIEFPAFLEIEGERTIVTLSAEFQTEQEAINFLLAYRSEWRAKIDKVIRSEEDETETNT